MHDIKVVMTHKEAITLFHKTKDDDFVTERYTGTDEMGNPETEVEWVYDWMGNGRTSWGVAWEDVPGRPRRLIRKMFDRYEGTKYGPRGQLVFSSRKEVYPPVFVLILY